MEDEWQESVSVLASELIFFSQRAATEGADELLASIGYGRAHYRALHMVRYHSGITTKGLLKQLKITAASLNRVMNQLIEDGYISQKNDTTDRRQRHHFLTKPGLKLQQDVFNHQRLFLEKSFSIAGKEAVENFLRVLILMLTEDDKKLLSVDFDTVTKMLKHCSTAEGEV